MRWSPASIFLCVYLHLLTVFFFCLLGSLYQRHKKCLLIYNCDFVHTATYNPTCLLSRIVITKGCTCTHMKISLSTTFQNHFLKTHDLALLSIFWFTKYQYFNTYTYISTEYIFIIPTLFHVTLTMSGLFLYGLNFQLHENLKVPKSKYLYSCSCRNQHNIHT